MPDIDLNALSHTVLWGTFALTFVFGAILQRTHFCTMGAVSDVVDELAAARDDLSGQVCDGQE